MSLKGKAYIAGIHEHPTRRADGVSTAQLHAEVALGALADAGLTLDDVDGYFCGADAPGLGGLTMAEYIGLNRLRHIDSTESGGSAYLLHVSHAAQAIAAGHCNVALITMADRPLAAGAGTSLAGIDRSTMPNLPFQAAVPPMPMYGYAMVARRHMHEFGTTPEQLAWVRVAASHHAQHNPHAVHRNVVTVDEVLASPIVADPLHRLDCCVMTDGGGAVVAGARDGDRTTPSTTRTRCTATWSRWTRCSHRPIVADPLHRLDCCVMTDGGGAVVLVRPEIARQLKRPRVKLLGAGEAVKHPEAGRIDLTWSAGVHSGAKAFAEAGVTPADIRYVSLYDSFTITVIVQLEDLGFCRKGEGGPLRRRRQPDLGRRRAALQHRRRRPVQQPPGQQGRHDEDPRSRAPVPRRGAPGRAGEGPRPGARARHRRQPGRRARGRHDHPGSGVTRMSSAKRLPPAPVDLPRRRAVLGGRPRRAPAAQALRPLRPFALLPAPALPAVRPPRDTLGRGVRPRHGVLALHRRARAAAHGAGDRRTRGRRAAVERRRRRRCACAAHRRRGAAAFRAHAGRPARPRLHDTGRRTRAAVFAPGARSARRAAGTGRGALRHGGHRRCRQHGHGHRAGVPRRRHPRVPDRHLGRGRREAVASASRPRWRRTSNAAASTRPSTRAASACCAPARHWRTRPAPT